MPLETFITFDEPVAATDFSPGNYTIKLSGPGATWVSDEDILNALLASGALSLTDKTDSHVLHPEPRLERHLLLKAGYSNTSNLHGQNLTITTTSATGESRDVNIRVYDTRNPPLLLQYRLGSHFSAKTKGLGDCLTV